MRTAIERSCNTYFWSMSHRVGYDAIAPVAKMLGLGQEFNLPGTKQRYGTIPDAAWKMRRYKQAWSVADSLNASIGQGYVSVSPLQLAVMTARIASGKNLVPALLYGKPHTQGPALPFTAEQLSVTHDGMFRVVNGSGTATASRLQVGDIKMAGKTGTAQVRRLVSRGSVGAWKSRDHSMFICYAPADAPRYAMSVVVEHGTFGARAAAPIARDVMTYLFDPATAIDTLHALEKQWGGTPSERMQAKYRAYAAQYGTTAPKVDGEAAVEQAITQADSSQAAVETNADKIDAERGEASMAPQGPVAAPGPPPPSSLPTTEASPSPTGSP
jgi:penicillin-binding protein 2